MAKYRKKPVVIEAFQITKETRESNADWPEWLHKAWNKNFQEIGSVSCEDYPNSRGHDRLVIQTLEGVLTVSWNDYIIQGVQGELYPCKPDIFEATYEPAE
jgi:hypothetical protein